MTESNGSSLGPAGWYKDQTGQLRWWDGNQGVPMRRNCR
ncbi:DUF2510 domain-containing protein [Pseudoclavibacter sp. CFCC 13611]|nr:DUF2510 domain-containing protein [Pseudoclavibacter sp. CFCC 13611]